MTGERREHDAVAAVWGSGEALSKAESDGMKMSIDLSGESTQYKITSFPRTQEKRPSSSLCFETQWCIVQAEQDAQASKPWLPILKPLGRFR